MATSKMYVWRDLSTLADYSNGLLCVIASSTEAALNLAVDAVCGTHPNCTAKREAFRVELTLNAPEVLTRGVAYVMGGS